MVLFLPWSRVVLGGMGRKEDVRNLSKQVQGRALDVWEVSQPCVRLTSKREEDAG